ncbi:MAG TPA: XRE family transcriptional regulator [Syntrophomonas sp.]|jgi:transcriptional regulator with XRE-family HTH domain|nr:XRE family transcriptional regulator [Syntrophomonas sp.]HCF71931.1 XRE family transcriptional regulator [Syntrophomonas sp.]
MVVNNLGIRLKKLRLEHALSQADLAQILGISRSAIASYENNLRNPDYDTLIHMAEFFEVKVDYLLGVNLLNFSSSVDYQHILREIHEVLQSSTLNDDKKQQIMNEVSDYFKWKIHQAQQDLPPKKE